jgi:hypothetical protein
MADALFGKRWNMVANSSLFSTSFKPQTEQRLYEVVPGGYKLTVSGSHEGKPYSWNYTALYDGKPHPVHGRDDVNSIVIHKIDDRTTVGFFLKDAAPGGPYARHLSLDGKTLVVEAAGRRTNGQPFYDVITYTL